MAEARCREHWARTSAILALMANIHRDHRKKPTPYRAEDFSPYHRSKGSPTHKVSIDVLKQVFVGGK